MLLKISRFCLIASLAAVLLVNKSFFFPFITGKQVFFRFWVELALAFFIFHLIRALLAKHQSHARETLKAISRHLKHPIVICLAILGIALIISAVFSPTPSMAFWSNYERGDGTFQILHYILFAILLKLLFVDDKKWHQLLAANIIISIPVCFYAFGQMFSSPNSTTFVAAGSRVSGTLGNPSYLAAYLIFNLAFITYFLLKSKDSFVRLGLIMLGAVQIFLMIKAQTLGAALGVFVGLVVFAVHLTFTTDNKKIYKAGLAVGGFVLGLSLLFIGTRQFSFWQHIPLFNRITDISKAYENIQPRLWTWSSAVSGVADRPLTGWGPENFAIPFDRHYDPLHYGQESFFDRTHNVFLQYLIDGGVLAFIPWLLLFYFYYRGLRKREASIWKSVLIALPVMYLVQGFFLFDVLAIYLPFFVLLLFAINTNPPPDDRPALPETLHDITPFSYVLIAATGVVFCVLIYKTAYAPLHRNRMIIGALNDGGQLIAELTTKHEGGLSKSPSDVFNELHAAIEYPSPIGRGEAVEMYQKFAVDFLGLMAQVPDAAKNKNIRNDVATIMTDLNATMDNNAGLVPGVKDRYVNATVNIRAGAIFNIPEYIQRGRKMIEDDLAAAPKRIELVKVLLDLGAATNDKALLATWQPVAAQLRPDLFRATK